jgi:copper(I)-binding protein
VGRRITVLGVLAATTLAVTAISAAAPGSSHRHTTASAAVTATAGELRIDGDAGVGYLDLSNAGTKQVVVQAAVSPVAASVLWTTAQQIVTSAHLFTASALCEDEPSLQAEADAAALHLHDLVIDPDGTLRLRPGSGSFQLTELTPGLHAGDHVPLTLYLDNGQQLTSELTVV